MWIAVCDNDIFFIERFMKLLNKAASKDDKITSYTSGIELLEDIRNNLYPLDLIFLDMKMPGLDGLETAKELRKVLPHTIIVVLTNYIEYAYEAYGIQASDYILKPCSREVIKEKISAARTHRELLSGPYIHIKTRQDNIFLSPVDIVYISSGYKELYIHTREKTYKSYRSLKWFLKNYEVYGFRKVHRSYIVNLYHMKQVNTSVYKIILSNGMEIPLAEKRAKEILNDFIDIKKKLPLQCLLQATSQF